jgi:hypothetical protein
VRPTAARRPRAHRTRRKCRHRRATPPSFTRDDTRHIVCSNGGRSRN